VQSLLGYPESYREVLPRIWGDPTIKQTVLVICAWTHGCIGISQVLRGKPVYTRWRDAWLIFAGLVPLLSLAGFVSAARELQAMNFQHQGLTRNDYFELIAIIRWALLALGAALTVTFAVVVWRILHRRSSGLVSIRYTGHGTALVN